MKRLISILLCMMITGCTKISGSLQSRIEEQIAAAANAPIMPANNRKTFYSYYLDPSLGRISSTDTGNVFSLDGVSFVMNLDVAKIVNEKYYPDQSVDHASPAKGETAAFAEGTVYDAYGNELNYQITVSECGAGLYLLNGECGYMHFESVCDQNKAPAIAARMITISRSAEIQPSEVLAVYTRREGIDYTGTPVELFEDKAPENGSIEELLVGYEGRTVSPEKEETEQETEKNTD